MKAIFNRSYGSPAALEFGDVDAPAVADGEVLVRVHAASANPLDWHFLTGTPYFLRLIAGLRRPKQAVRGADMAGVVERVGASVTGLVPGDRVFGVGRGTFAEFAVASPERITRIADGVGFEDAAALPVAAVTALQGLRDHGRLAAGQSVLIIGAAGGVGTYAVQIAKLQGAEVTGVCSTRNVDMVRSLGADHVVDYTVDDFAASGRRYDVILDNVGNRSLADCRRALAPAGIYVMVSGPKTGKLLGPANRVLAAKVTFLIARRRMASFTANERVDDLNVLMAWMEAGQLRSVVERRYPLADTADAIRYLAEGHARSKLVITVVDNS